MPMPSRNLGNLGAAAHHCDCLGQAADTAADNQASIDRCHRHDPYPLCSALKQLSRRIAERGERGRESGQSMASWKKRLTVAIRKYCHRDNVAFAIIGNKFAVLWRKRHCANRATELQKSHIERRSVR
jgi:hypothetical protein